MAKKAKTAQKKGDGVPKGELCPTQGCDKPSRITQFAGFGVRGFRRHCDAGHINPR